jgi:hypothetical protein
MALVQRARSLGRRGRRSFRVKLVLDRIPYLEAATDDDFTDLRRGEATGRPLGMEDFVVGLEKLLGRPIARRTHGRRTSSEVEQNRQMDLP